MKSVWFNVTSSYFWRGEPVGIIRTEVELVKQLKRHYGTRLNLCIWDGGRFKLVTEREYQLSFQQEETNKEQVSANSAQICSSFLFPIISRKEAMKNIAQGVLSLTPSRIRPQVNSFLSTLKDIVLFLVRRSRFICQNTMKQSDAEISSNVDDNTIFAEGEVFLSAGLDWDSKIFEHFYALRVKKNIKVVTFCYDLIPVLFPQYCVSYVPKIFPHYLLEIADASTCIISISNRTKEDLTAWLENAGSRIPEIRNIRLGSNYEIKQSGELSDKVKKALSAEFILYVSTVERRKNHEVLYRAYHKLLQKHGTLKLPRLIFVGMIGWGVNDLIQDIKLDPLIQGKILFIGRVSDYELEVLYKKALFVAFPSLYEGYGLGVAEALSRGKFVLASSTGSLPEVGGDLVQYLDPWSVDAWSAAIKNLIEDRSKLASLESSIKTKYYPKTWQAASEDLIDIIEKI